MVVTCALMDIHTFQAMDRSRRNLLTDFLGIVVIDIVIVVVFGLIILFH